MKREDDFVMKNTRTLLRHDLQYLRCVIVKTTGLYPGRTPEDRVALGVLRDYLTWLAVDAMTDEWLARRFVHTIAKLQEELHTEAESHHTQDIDPTATAFYEGFLHGLEQAISFRYGVDLLLDEEISWGEFLESWERTRERIGL